MTPQETDPDLPVNDQESPAEAWVRDSPPQGQGTECGNACTGPFERGCIAIIFITPTIAWSQGKQHEGNTALPINRKLD